MKRFIYILLFFELSFTQAQNGDYLIAHGNDTIIFSNSGNPEGLVLSSIRHNGHEVLHDSTCIFQLKIKDLRDNSMIYIDSRTHWNQLQIFNHTDTLEGIFSRPVISGLPYGLTVKFRVFFEGNVIQWTLSIDSIGQNHSLMEYTFPVIDISAPGNDYFLIPKYSGVLLKNPLQNQIDYNDIYPRGWGWTMPWMAYYGNDYGLYLGAHDPVASYKNLSISAINGGLRFRITIPAIRLGEPGNDQRLPGVFAMVFFEGDWYDAAMVYKNWAEQNAVYWPVNAQERRTRQHRIGEIAVWAYISEDTTVSMANLAQQMIAFRDLFDSIPSGFLWSQWNYQQFDDNYPDYFPERDSMEWVIEHVQDGGRAFVTPYINGRLYDTDLPDYPALGYPDAAKNANGIEYTQTFNGNVFAVMCPAQDNWQDTLEYAVNRLSNRIGASGVYVDQVCAAGPVLCMDTTHAHPAGGGHYWRDGYAQMFGRFHTIMPATAFITTEGAADFIANQTDGFLTLGWTTAHMVPAHQAVYSGKVQYFSLALYSSQYNDEAFYTKLAQGLTTGIQPGQFYCYFARDPNAATARPFVQNIVKMRYRLRNYLSYGRLLHPLDLQGNIPEIQTVWYEGDIPVNVRIKAVQNGVFAAENNRSIVILLVNASMTEEYDFSFNFNGSSYGFTGDLYLREVSPDSMGTVQSRQNSFTQNVHLEPLETKAYEIGRDSTFFVENITATSFPFSIFPNPAKEFWEIKSKAIQNFKWKLFDFSGRRMAIGTSNKYHAIIKVPESGDKIWILRIEWQNKKRTFLLMKR